MLAQIYLRMDRIDLALKQVLVHRWELLRKNSTAFLGFSWAEHIGRPRTINGGIIPYTLGLFFFLTTPKSWS